MRVGDYVEVDDSEYNTECPHFKGTIIDFVPNIDCVVIVLDEGIYSEAKNTFISHLVVHRDWIGAIPK